MGDSTRIEEIISQAALKGFDELNAKVNASIENLERLVVEATKINTAFATVKGPREFNQSIKDAERVEKELIKTTLELKLAQDKLENANALHAQKTAINELTLKNKALLVTIKEQALESKKALEQDKLAAQQAKLKSDEEKKAAAEQSQRLRKERDERDALLRERERAEGVLFKAELAQREKIRIAEKLRLQNEKDAQLAISLQNEKDAQAKKAIADAAAAAAKVSGGTKTEAADIDRLSDSYTHLVHASVQNQQESKKLVETKKNLNKAFKDGLITEEQYENGLKEIRLAQLRVSNSGLELNKSLKLIAGATQSAVGSLNALKGELNLSLSAFDRLSREERRSATGRELNNKIKALTKDITEQEQATGRFQRNVGNYSSAVKGLGSNLLFAAGAGLGIMGLSSFLTGVVDEFNQAEQATTRFKGILDNIGRVDVFPRLTKEAEDLAKEFSHLDNDNIIEVFQQLITYGKLTESQIKKLTPVIIDFAAKQGISLEQSASVIIKALEGNGRALKEYGINMKDAGTTTEAFGLIMTELKPKVDGAAKAFGETLAGSAAKTKQEIANLKEEIGTGLSPVIKGFYETLSAAIDGIPQLFSQVGKNLSALAGPLYQLKLAGQLVGDLFTGGPAAAINRISSLKSQREETEKLKKQTEELADAEKLASLIAKDASTKTPGERDKVLNNQIALANASQRAYDALVKSGKQFTEEGKKAGFELKKNLIITTSLFKAFEADDDTTTLGTGDADKSFTKTSESNEKIRAVNKKFFDDELRDQADALKSLSKDMDLYLTDRLDKRKAAFNIEQNLIKQSTAIEIQNEKDKLNAVKDAEAAKGKGGSKIAVINAENEYTEKIKEITEKSDFTLRKLETTLNGDLLQIKNTFNAKRLEEDRKANEEFITQSNKLIEDRKKTELTAINSRAEREINGIDADRDAQLRVINDTANARLQAAEGNAIKIDKIEREAAHAGLDVQIKADKLKIAVAINAQKQLLAVAKTDANQDEIAKATAKIKELEKQLSELDGKSIHLDIDIKTDKLDKLLSIFDKIREAGSAVFDTLSGVVNASVTRQKNVLQDQADEAERASAREIDAINASADSEEKKAARVQLVNARTQAQKEVIAQRQRQLDQRNAEVQKAQNIFEIIINTAAAVVKGLKDGGPPLGILYGALGAAQLAVAIATPVPRFEKGTMDAPGGLAIVGEKRKELIVTPSGEMIETPGTQVMMTIPKHSIVFPDMKKIMERGIGKRPLVNISQKDNSAMYYYLGGKLDTLGKIIKNKTETHISRKGDGWEQIKKSGGNQTRYL